MISALDNMKNLCYNYIIEKGGFQYMNYSEKILSSIQTIAKSQDKSFDRTIQAIVLDNSDTEQKGEIKVQYQDAILKVYCDIGDVRKYSKGSNVYVTVPNGNMSGRKTILGLVESVGALEVKNYLDTLVTEMMLSGNNNSQIVEKEYKQIGLNNGDNFLEDDDPPEDAPGIILNDNIIALINQSEELKISFNLETNIDKSAYPLDDINFGFKLILGYEDGERIKFTFDIDKIQGNPLFVPNIEQIFLCNCKREEGEGETKKRVFCTGAKIIFFRKGFHFLKDNVSNLIKFSNFIFEAVYQAKPVETTGSALYIIAPKGTCFSKKRTSDEYKEDSQNGEVVTVPQDTLTLQAAVKVNGVQVDNSSLKCQWFARGFDNYSDDQTDESAIQYWPPFNKDNTSNQIEITRDDLNGATERQFKVVGLYKGIELEAVINIQDLNVEPNCSFIKNENQYEVTLNDIQQFGKVIWYLSIGAGSQYLLGIFEKNNIGEIVFQSGEYSYLLGNPIDDNDKGWYKEINFNDGKFSIKLNTNKIVNAGIVYCEVYYQSDNPFKIFSAEYKGQIPEENYYIENGEQVFLQTVTGEIFENTEENASDVQKMNYLFKPRQLKIIGPAYSSIKWYINNEETASQGPIFNLEQYLNFSGNKINNKITNIRAEVTRQGEDSINLYPNISYVTEGDNGTNSSGYYVRIVPNISSFSGNNSSNITPLVIFEYENNIIKNYKLNYNPEDSRGVAASDNNLEGIYPFKVQIWNNNDLIFNGTKSNQNSSISWTKNRDKQNSLLSKLLKSGKFRKLDGLSDKKLDQNKNQPAYIYATYNNITAVLPVCCAFVEKDSKIIDFNFNKDNQLIYYYNENGELEEKNKEEYDLFKNIYLVSSNIDNNKSLVFSLENSLCNNFTILENNKFKQNDNYGGDSKLDAFVYVGQDKKEMIDDKGNKYYIDVTFLNIPLKAMIKSVFASLLVNWSGKQAVFEEDENYIAAEKIYAGTRGNNNSFSGVVLGQKDEDENGVILYNNNNRTLYLDSTGKIIIGQDYNNRLVIDTDAEEDTISSVGIHLNHITGEAQFNAINFKDTDDSPITVKQENNTKFQLQNDGTLGLTTIYGLYEKTDSDIFNERIPWKFYNYTINSSGTEILSGGIDSNDTDIKRYGDLYLDNQGRIGAKFLYIGKGDTRPRDSSLFGGWFINSQFIAYNTTDRTESKKNIFLDINSGLTIANDKTGEKKEVVAKVQTNGKIICTNGFLVGVRDDNTTTWELTKEGLTSYSNNHDSQPVILRNNSFWLSAGDNNLNYIHGETNGDIEIGHDLKVLHDLWVDNDIFLQNGKINIGESIISYNYGYSEIHLSQGLNVATNICAVGHYCVGGNGDPGVDADITFKKSDDSIGTIIVQGGIITSVS